MNIKTPVSALVLALSLSSIAHASANDEITIRMMQNNETSQDSITKVIPLPDKNRYTQQIQNQNQLQTKKQQEDNDVSSDELQQRIREQEQIREVQDIQLQIENQHNEQTQDHAPQIEHEIPETPQGAGNNASRP